MANTNQQIELLSFDELRELATFWENQAILKDR